VEGSAAKHDVWARGAGDVDAFGLQSRDAVVRLTSSGSVKVHATSTLDVTLTGGGDVQYRGSPRVTKNVTGSGRVVPRD
jgi:hypothetical protein